MIVTELPSPNCDDRPGGVDTLILHYTGMQSAAAAVARLRDPAAKVSAHYVVDEDGAVFRLVPEAKRAYHAGISYWRGRRALNDVSIGIEIVNPGHEWGYRPFPPAQMAALRDLCLEILARHPIPACNVVGHSDVAPNRKQDPGELFDWAGLAASGIGVWPSLLDQPETAPEEEFARSALREIGYDVGFDLACLLTSFQRRFLPAALHGRLDPATMARLRAVRQVFAPVNLTKRLT